MEEDKRRGHGEDGTTLNRQRKRQESTQGGWDEWGMKINAIVVGGNMSKGGRAFSSSNNLIHCKI